MFGKSRAPKPARQTRSAGDQAKEKMTWDVPVFFFILFALSIAELVLTVDSFQYLQKTHTWKSSSQRSSLAFLIFSAARMIALSAVYCGFHCAQKVFHSMLHTVFLVISTILWIVSGVLIHRMYGVIICNQGVGGLKGGLTECHELKIIEIIAWVIAGVSVIATIPVTMNAMKRRKRQHDRKTATSG